MSEMEHMGDEHVGHLGTAARRRWRDLKKGGNITCTWRAVRDVLLPTLVDIADELDALRREKGTPKREHRIPPENITADADSA